MTPSRDGKMLKTFIKHHIYEKCINLVFDGIIKRFKQPELEYEILNTEEIKENGYDKQIYTVRHKGKIYRVSMGTPETIKLALTQLHGLHGMSDEEADKKMAMMTDQEIRHQIDIEENCFGNKDVPDEVKENVIKIRERDNIKVQRVRNV